jgi:PKD repeat protein
MNGQRLRADLSHWLDTQGPVPEVEVKSAVGRGHRAYLRWVTVRGLIGLVAAALLVFATAVAIPQFTLSSQSLTADGYSAASVARLTVTPSDGPAPLTVTASATLTGPNPAKSYLFDFGDGYVLGPQTGSSGSHTYKGSGTATVKVTIVDTAGASATASATVTVELPPVR